MAGKVARRIEPTFDKPRRAGLSVSDADRVLPARKPAGRGAAKARAAPRRSKRSRPRRLRLMGRAGRLIYWSLVLMLWAGIGGAGMVAWYGARMPAATTWSIPGRSPNIGIVSVDGRLIANRGMTGGEAVGLDEMSSWIPAAVVAIEDRRFYSHFGVDLLGLARAMVANLAAGRLVEGGSTITQQLAKNLFLKPDRTIERKVQEVLLALWLEHRHSKAEILEMYLNRVYFGSGAYGVEAAARRYFSKGAGDVTLSEAALLAGLLKAPSRLSPARDPKAAGERAELVLAAMREQRRIGDRDMTAALSAPASRAASYWTGSENYVADRVMEELPSLIGEVDADIVVETTVDLDLQKLAEASIRRLVGENGRKLSISQGALVSIDNSGAVRAMVGGYDYAASQFDRASEARRQPGSAFKPFVFLAALEQGRTPDSVRNDAPVRIGKWTPDNYQGKYFGRVTLATALARSLNSVAAQLVMEVGPDAVVEAARRLGIESELTANSSIALGTSEVTPLELTAAYVPFANGGYRPDVHFIGRIRKASGEVLYEHRGGGNPRVLRPEIVGMMNAMMTGTIEAGTARKAAFAWPAAGKTGTSQNSRDAWFIGYTANLTTGVWFGNDDGSPMKRVTGGGPPAEAWHEFMVAAHQGVPKVELPGRWASGQGETASREASPAKAPSGAAGKKSGDGEGGFHPPGPDMVAGSDAPAASIRRPVADVGAPPQKRRISITEFLTGG